MLRRSSVRAFLVLGGLLCVWTPSILRSAPQSANPPQEAKSSPLDQYKPRGFVNDFAGIIDAQSQAKLEALGEKLDQEKSAQLAIVTVESLDGMPIKDFATQLANRWGVGRKDTDMESSFCSPRMSTSIESPSASDSNRCLPTKSVPRWKREWCQCYEKANTERPFCIWRIASPTKFSTKYPAAELKSYDEKRGRPPS